MSEVRIAAEPRTEFGKGAARRLRRDGKVPAVLYGHGTEPAPRRAPGPRADARAQDRQRPARARPRRRRPSSTLPKSVQRDPVKRTLEHVDLVLVRRGEKVTVEVPLARRRRPRAAAACSRTSLNTLSRRGRGHPHPAVDRGRRSRASPVGDAVHAGDITLPEGVDARRRRRRRRRPRPRAAGRPRRRTPADAAEGAAPPRAPRLPPPRPDPADRWPTDPTAD